MIITVLCIEWWWILWQAREVRKGDGCNRTKTQRWRRWRRRGRRRRLTKHSNKVRVHSAIVLKHFKHFVCSGFLTQLTMTGKHKGNLLCLATPWNYLLCICSHCNYDTHHNVFTLICCIQNKFCYLYTIKHLMQWKLNLLLCQWKAKVIKWICIKEFHFMPLYILSLDQHIFSITSIVMGVLSIGYLW